jgi:hypothetical protein
VSPCACLIDGIEEAGIERQISPYRSGGIKQQWHYGEGGALRQCGGNLGCLAGRTIAAGSLTCRASTPYKPINKVSNQLATASMTSFGRR